MKTNKILLPKLRENQIEIKNDPHKYKVVCCGRRFGKNIVAEDEVVNRVLNGQLVAWIEPSFKMIKKAYREINKILLPAITKANDCERIELNTGGIIDFWSLENYDSVRGSTYNFIVINEAAFSRNLKDAWEEAISPTLLDFNGDCWFLSTPKGKNYFQDLFEMDSKDEDFKSFHFTSYDNNSTKGLKQWVDKKRNSPNMSEIKFRQEYLAEFISLEGALLKNDYIKYINLNEMLNRDEFIANLNIVMGVDLAISQKETADYTAFAVIGIDKKTGNIYVLDIIRFRAPFNTIVNNIQEVANKWHPRAIGIESVQAQEYVVQELMRTTSLPIKSIKVQGDKSYRFLPILGRYEHGLVFHDKNLNSNFENELLSFPLGEHKDMVDAVTLAFNMVNRQEMKIEIYKNNIRM